MDNRLAGAVFLCLLAVIALDARVRGYREYTRWGRSGKGPPISVVGQYLFGLWFGLFGAGFFFINRSKIISTILSAFLVVILVALFLVSRWDNRRWKSAQRKDGGQSSG
jgi:hypothetical protein